MANKRIMNGLTLNFKISFSPILSSKGYNTFKITDTLKSGLEFTSATGVYNTSTNLTNFNATTTDPDKRYVEITFDNPYTDGTTPAGTIEVTITATIKDASSISTGTFTNTAKLLVNGLSTLATDSNEMSAQFELITATPQLTTGTPLAIKGLAVDSDAPLEVNFTTLDISDTFKYLMTVALNSLLKSPSTTPLDGFSAYYVDSNNIKQSVTAKFTSPDTLDSVNVEITNSSPIQNKTIYIELLPKVKTAITSYENFESVAQLEMVSSGIPKSSVGLVSTVPQPEPPIKSLV